MSSQAKTVVAAAARDNSAMISVDSRYDSVLGYFLLGLLYFVQIGLCLLIFECYLVANKSQILL